jgi:hypothetical protein
VPEPIDHPAIRRIREFLEWTEREHLASACTDGGVVTLQRADLVTLLALLDRANPKLIKKTYI